MKFPSIKKSLTILALFVFGFLYSNQAFALQLDQVTTSNDTLLEVQTINPNALKAKGDDIIKSIKLDDYACDNQTAKCIKKDKVVKYYYLGQKIDSGETLKIKNSTYKEFSRTDNAVYYKNSDVNSTDPTNVVKIYENSSVILYNGEFYSIESATTSVDNFLIQNTPTAFNFQSFFINTAVADVVRTESNATDGSLSAYNRTTFAGVHDSATADYFNWTNTTISDQALAPGVLKHPSGNYTMGRGKFSFATAPIPDNAQALTGSIFLTTDSYINTCGNLLFNISTSTQASTTELLATDYARFGNTYLSSSTPINSMLSGTHEWILNSTGTSTINLTGDSYFGLRLVKDMDNVDPSCSANTSSYFVPRSSEYSGTSSDPYAVFTYTVPSSGGTTSTSTATTTCNNYYNQLMSTSTAFSIDSMKNILLLLMCGGAVFFYAKFVMRKF